MSNPPSNLHVEFDDDSDRFTNLVSNGSDILATALTELLVCSNNFMSVPVMDILTNNSIGNIEVSLIAPSSLLSFSNQILSSVKYTQLRLKMSSSSQINADIQNTIRMEDVKSGLNRNISLSVLPNKSLVSNPSLSVVSPSDNFSSWHVIFSDTDAVSMQLNGVDVAMNIGYISGGAGDKVTLSPKSSSLGHYTVHLNGRKADNSVVDRTLIVQYGAN